MHKWVLSGKSFTTFIIVNCLCAKNTVEKKVSCVLNLSQNILYIRYGPRQQLFENITDTEELDTLSYVSHLISNSSPVLTSVLFQHCG